MKPLVCLFLPAWCWAQVTFDVGPPEVGLNEIVSFTITVEDGDRGRNPSFPDGLRGDDFELASRSPSTSFQTSIVNGVYRSTRSYTYRLRPKRKGDLAFPAQTIVYAGKRFTSEPRTIKVGEPRREVPMRDPLYDPFDRFVSPTRGPAEVFAVMETPKTEYYLGEEIPLTVKLYRSRGVQIYGQGSSMDMPDFLDFWVEEAPNPSNEREAVYNGRRYIELIVGKRRLYANKTGQLQIPPTKFSLAVKARPSFSLKTQQVERATEPLTVTVKPLPTAGRPAEFDGLVGHFSIDGELEKEEPVKVGDSVSIKVTVRGDGNFAALQNPKLDGIENDFEIFEGGAPTVENGQDGAVVAKTWTFALVPKREGSFRVAAPRIAYFDLRSESYKTTAAKDFVLDVAPGAGGALSRIENGARAGFAAERNLSFIKMGELAPLDANPKLIHPRGILFAAGGFAALNALAFLALLIRNQTLSRRASHRPKYALRQFKRNAARLRRQSENPDAFYAGLSEAILGYFGDKWGRAGQGLSLDYIHERFHRDGVDERHGQNIKECIETCDLARFTPSTPSSREQLLDKAVAAVEDVEGALP